MEEREDEWNEQAERPWIALQTTYDVEAWIDSYNRELRRHVGEATAPGRGICFVLAHGGEIFLHTTEEGAIWLDLMPEAQWAAPVIEAATGVASPAGQIWQLPGDRLTQLIFGLSSLIGSTRLVRRHDYGKGFRRSC